MAVEDPDRRDLRELRIDLASTPVVPAQDVRPVPNRGGIHGDVAHIRGADAWERTTARHDNRRLDDLVAEAVHVHEDLEIMREALDE